MGTETGYFRSICPGEYGPSLAGDFMGSMAPLKIVTASMMSKVKDKHSFDVQPYLDTTGMARKTVAFLRGTTTFAQGDPCNTVLYVQEDTVKLTVIDESGKEAVIALLGAGDILGEKCISNNSPVRHLQLFSRARQH